MPINMHDLPATTMLRAFNDDHGSDTLALTARSLGERSAAGCPAAWASMGALGATAGGMWPA